jgi:hypothetical protein
MQMARLTPHYTTYPFFQISLQLCLFASLIAIGLNFVFSMLGKMTTDIEKMNMVMNRI